MLGQRAGDGNSYRLYFSIYRGSNDNKGTSGHHVLTSVLKTTAEFRRRDASDVEAVRRCDWPGVSVAAPGYPSGTGRHHVR